MEPVKLHVYNIGYGTCEESSRWQYFHTDEFTDAQLREIVIECMVDALAMDADHEPASQGDPMFVGIHPGDKGPRYADIMESTFFHNALRARKFIKVKFQAAVSFFGWASAVDGSDWGAYRTSDSGKDADALNDKIARAGLHLIHHCRHGRARLVVARRVEDLNQDDGINNLKLMLTWNDRQYSRVYKGQDLEDMRAHYQECLTNGANPYLRTMSFGYTVRDLYGERLSYIKKFNATDANYHVVFGLIECLEQSNDFPSWLDEAKPEDVEVSFDCNELPDDEDD